MPNHDPPWSEPQDTQHCPRCEELARQLFVAKELLKYAYTTLFAVSVVNGRPPDEYLDEIMDFIKEKTP